MATKLFFHQLDITDLTGKSSKSLIGKLGNKACIENTISKKLHEIGKCI